MAKNPDQVVALKYDAGADEAPKIVAKGSDVLAERIIQIAKEHGVPVHEDRNLVRILSMLEVNDEIPPKLYFAVAEILSFLYRTGQSRG